MLSTHSSSDELTARLPEVPVLMSTPPWMTAWVSLLYSLSRPAPPTPLPLAPTVKPRMLFSPSPQPFFCIFHFRPSFRLTE